jgi:hypothetical protein
MERVEEGRGGILERWIRGILEGWIKGMRGKGEWGHGG